MNPEGFLARVATAPISWGVCEVPGWGHQLSPERVLGEMNELGFTATELGSYGWLPTDTAELIALLNQHQLGLLASFVPLVIHDADQVDSQLLDARRHAAMLAEAGAIYFNTAPITSPDWQPRSPLSDDQWATAYGTLSAIDQICAEHGLVNVLHEHVGCIVETAAEVEMILDNTDTKFVLDTGHLAVGGFDPVDFVRNHADRVGLVHLKDTKLDVAQFLNNGRVTLMEAVQQQLFPALGHGDLDIATVVTELERSGFQGWYVIEQDCALTGDLPGIGEGPVRDVETSVSYLCAVDDKLARMPASSSAT